MTRLLTFFLATSFLFGFGSSRSAFTSDHDDTPLLRMVNRHDARITDLHAFVRGDNLVISVCSNPMIPTSATSYRFPSDVTFDINIDYDSEVSPEDPDNLGGTIVNPAGIREDITYRLRFISDQLTTIGHIRSDGRLPDVWLRGSFTGLRDDPFIRGPRIGRNVAAIVLEIPLASVLKDQSTLLIWATTKVDTLDGPFQDMAGRSLRSQEPDNLALNTFHPSEHLAQTGLKPDVMIYDTAKPAAFPNGRALTDDVVDLTAVPRILESDAPFPSTNDVPFLETFPYLAPPQPPR